MPKDEMPKDEQKNLLLMGIRIVLSYVFLVAAIYAALSLDGDHIGRAAIISVVWLGLASIDELVFWKLVRSNRR